MAVKTEPPRVHDVLLYETDQRYTRREVTFRHSAGVDTTFEVGQGLITSSSKRVPVSGDTIDAILAQRLVLVPTATDVLRVAVWVKGPLILNQDALVLASGHETANKAALELLAMHLVSEPVKQTNG